MNLDQFASTIGTRSSHPRGEFVGVVESIKREQIGKQNTTFVVIKVKTSSGYAPDFKLGFVSEEDFTKAKFMAENGQNEGLNKISTIISMTKGFLVRMGLVHKDSVEMLGYNQSLKELPRLMGQKVKVQVIAQKNNPDFDQTNLSKYDAPEVSNSTSPHNGGYSVDDVPF
jgi:hypothetical protein